MEIKYLYIFVCLVAYICDVHSGRILDKLNTVATGVKCNLHKIGDTVYHHQHSGYDPCTQQKPHRHHPNDLEDNLIFKNSEETSYKVSTPSSRVSDTTSKKPPIPEMGSRTLIKAGANCPDGYSADKSGTCREEY